MPEVIIIGGGFSGLAMAVQLRRKLGMQDFLILEKSSSLGGVWAANRYPGAACDIPSAFYSFSFAQQYWKDLFSDGATIRDYAERVASQYHVLESNTLFQAEVVGAQWSDKTERWNVVVRTAAPGGSYVSHYTCKVLVSAVGNLTIPNELTVPGTELFRGRILHTGAWDERLDLNNKRVIVLGNGCSAQQLVPAIAPRVQHLTIFSPSRHWYLPRPTLPLPWLFDALCKYTTIGRHLLRFALFMACEDVFRCMSWKSGEAAREQQEKLSREFVERAAPAKYRSQLVPKFAFGSKRVVFDSGFLSTLHRDNVDYFAESVREIVEDGVVMQDGTKIQADIIVAATGFQAQPYLHPLDIKGQQGKDLQDHMRGDGRGLRSYKGTFYSSFPNFASLYGPNLGTGHSSAIFTQECQVDMVIKRMITPILQEEDVNTVMVRPEAEAAWQDWLRREMRKTVWENEQSGSWYTDARGFCTTLYPRSQVHLWWSMVTTPLKDFIYMPRESKALYGTEKEFEWMSYFAGLSCLAALLVLLHVVGWVRLF